MAGALLLTLLHKLARAAVRTVAIIEDLLRVRGNPNAPAPPCEGLPVVGNELGSYHHELAEALKRPTGTP